MPEAPEGARTRATRVPVNTPAQIFVRADFDWGRVRDFSPGGAFVETATPAPLQERVFLTFLLPRMRDPIWAVGEVAWTRNEGPTPHGMGVRFQWVSEKDRERVGQYYTAELQRIEEAQETFEPIG